MQNHSGIFPQIIHRGQEALLPGGKGFIPGDSGRQFLVKHGFENVHQIGKMIIEGLPVDFRVFADLLHRDLVQGFDG